MAKSQPKMLEVDPETGRIIGDDPEGPEVLQADQDKQLDDIIAEFGAGDENVTYRASINKVPDGYKKGGKEEFCLEVDSAEVTGIRLKLRDEFGAGIYRIRVFKNNKQYRQFDYHIAKQLISRPVSQSADNAAVQALTEQIRTLSENQNKLMERLLSGPANNNQPDPFLMMERMSTIMKNMMPQQNPSVPDHSFTMKDGIELFTKGMEISADMRGADGDSWISVFKEIAKNIPVGDILDNLTKMQQQRNNPQMRQQLPAPQQIQPHQNYQPPQQTPNNGIAKGSPAEAGEQFQASMRYLIGRAQKNSDPGLYGEWLLDNAPRELIAQMVNDVNVMGQLAALFPALNQPLINAWFVELVEAVKEILANSPENGNIAAGIAQPATDGNTSNGAGGHAQNTGRSAGDQNDAQNHAGPGQAGPA